MTVPRPALAKLLNFEGVLEIADIGAALINEDPPYKPLLDLKLGRLSAFEADARQHAALRQRYGDDLRLFGEIVGDGGPGTLHLAAPASGMTSLLKPSARGLGFFNGFDRFGEIHDILPVQTTRLDDVAGLPDLDFVKMDIQGGELAALESGQARLARCAAVQLEVSFVPLYEGQPTFGDIDVWMRSRGFLPHAFTELKRWSIAPVLRNNDIRQPFQQLLEADVVYVRDPTTPERWDPDVLRRLVLIVHYTYASFDLAGRLVLELERAGHAEAGAFNRYIQILQTGGA